MEYAELLLGTVFKARRRWKTRKLRRLERQLERQLVIDFAKQQKDVVAAYKKVFDKKSYSRKTTASEVDGIVSVIDNTGVSDSLKSQCGLGMLYGAKITIKEQQLARVGISFSLDHPLASQYFNTTRSLEYAKIGDTTKKKIRPILKDAIETGKSVDEVAKTLKDSFAFSQNRSIMISSNEMGHAYEEGKIIPMYDAVAEGHKVEKIWQTVGDSRVTQECQDYEAMGWIDFDRDFVSSGGTIDFTAPRDSHPRCRCNVQSKTTFNNDNV